MNILFIIPKLSYSGAPRIMAWIANGMAKRGHNVTIVVIYRSECEQFLDKRVKIVFLGVTQSKRWLYRNTIGMLKAVLSCRRAIKMIRPDTVISFLDSISQIYILLNSFFWKNNVIVSERVDPYSRRKLQVSFLSFLMKRSNLVVFQTKEARDFFRGKQKKLNDCVIPNPIIVDSSVRTAIKERKQMNNLERKDFKISSVGRLSLKQKRQDVLLKAMTELKNNGIEFRLYVYGSGSDENVIKKMIEENSLGKYVKMMGQKKNIPSEIFDSDCFVLTSDFEGIPNALAEAMSIGIPCISTDCSPGGAKLLINDGINGYLVDRGDYKSIAEKIIWIKEHKKASKTIGENATKIVDNFSEEKIMDFWEKRIGNVVKR